ncbi:hypothetical protein C8R47DRAFT_641005 [Mycena vitilis]|nr:hypothetical protein C8R47DRAFT_641005 [Mycena vitilis]
MTPFHSAPAAPRPRPLLPIDARTRPLWSFTQHLAHPVPHPIDAASPAPTRHHTELRGHDSAQAARRLSFSPTSFPPLADTNAWDSSAALAGICIKPVCVDPRPARVLGSCGATFAHAGHRRTETEIAAFLRTGSPRRPRVSRTRTHGPARPAAVFRRSDVARNWARVSTGGGGQCGGEGGSDSAGSDNVRARSSSILTSALPPLPPQPWGFYKLCVGVGGVDEDVQSMPASYKSRSGLACRAQGAMSGRRTAFCEVICNASVDVQPPTSRTPHEAQPSAAAAPSFRRTMGRRRIDVPAHRATLILRARRLHLHETPRPRVSVLVY